jgi:DNA-binding NtrC family response regulator
MNFWIKGAIKMKNTVKILHFENNETNARLIESCIELENISCEFKKVFNTEDYLSSLKTDLFDIVLCDSSLPYHDWINAVSFVREIAPNTSFILVSPTQDEVNVDELRNYRLEDYIQNAKLDNINPIINRALSKLETYDNISFTWG